MDFGLYSESLAVVGILTTFSQFVNFGDFVQFWVFLLGILDIEKKYKYLKNENSPSKKVGYEPSSKFTKVVHDVPMLSLSNAFSEENIVDFLKKIRNFLNLIDFE